MRTMLHIKSTILAENGVSPQSSSSIRSSGLLLITLHIPRILSYILPYLEWMDFYSLSNSCRHCHLLLEDLESKDAILSRFVPWYAHAMRLRDPLNGYKDVPVSVKDLDLLRKPSTASTRLTSHPPLVTSQRIPLHQYPLHARQSLASSHSVAGVTSWLESLTHAHSRFVLLLQAYVHCSNDVLQPEPDDAIWPWPEPSGQLRKLTFPAPLLYYPSELPGSEKRRSSKNSTGQSQNGRNVRGTMTSRVSSRADESAGLTSAALPFRSFPFFGRTSTWPIASKGASINKSWRRSSTINHIPNNKTDYESTFADSSHWFAHPKDYSTNSSLYSGLGSGSSPLSVSRNSLFFTGPSSSAGSVNGTAPRSFGPHLQSVTRHSFTSGHAYHPMRMTSPLDLSFAVSRARAPILRVFVPFSDHQDASQELLSCEQQLIDAGLWDHLSAGDLVCNLGYVPPIDGDDMHAPCRGLDRRSDYRQKRQSYGQSSHFRKWLLYNGQFLVPYQPPEAISLPDPLGLPTPFYYMHVMPPYTNPVYVIDGLGLGDISTIQLEMRLVHTMTKVRSPHSPAGRALVRKHAWIARVLRSPAFCDRRTGQELHYIGDGWVGEWILESEGTKEGKEILFDCVLGKVTGPMEWEVVVERCGGGRIYLRLLSILSRTMDMHPRTSIQNL